MDLNLIVNNTLADLKEEGYVEKIVKAQLEETLKDIVRSSFRSYGDFGKTLEEEIKKQMDINLEKLDIPSYNQVILNTVKTELERSVHEEGAKKIQEQIQDLLGTSKKEYKLSELIQEIVEQDCELEELSYEECEEITVIIEEKYGSKYIYIDPEDEKEWYQCKYQLVLDKDDMTVKRAEIGDKSFDNKVIMGGLYGVDSTIFKMWTRGSKILIDNYETEFSNPEFD